MTTETVLTDEQRELLFILHMEDFMDGESADRAIKAIERAVLRSPEVQQMRKDKARLDSGVIMTHERDEFGLEYMSERRGVNLRAAIDAAMEKKE